MRVRFCAGLTAAMDSGLVVAMSGAIVTVFARLLGFGGRGQGNRPLQQMKIAPGPLHVFADLLLESIRRGKFDLRTAPAQERNLNLSLRREFHGMKVEQVGFNGKDLVLECWSLADIGYGIEYLAAHSRASDVDAVGGCEFVVAAQIDGGNGVLVPVAASSTGR